MCGIVGLYLKTPELRPTLGALFRPMLREMTSRGPDSAGVALYRDPVEPGFTKFSLAHDDEDFDWKGVDTGLEQALDCEASVRQVATHCILVTDGEEKAVTAWLREAFPDVRLVGSGESIEIFKEVGLPDQVYDRFDLDRAQGSHIIGHTRMATESRRSPWPVQPPLFDTGEDLCLVHNGSLSNHNRLRLTTCSARGVDFRDRKRYRGGRRLPDLEACAREADAAPGAGGRHSRTSTASTPSASAPATASPCCAIRSPASTRCWPRRTTGWPWPPSTARSPPCPGIGQRDDLGARAARRSTAGSGGKAMGDSA